MHVDDRLATVLNARADGDVAIRIQYRQLLDLVGTSGAAARSDLLDQALLRLGELAGTIPAEQRARFLAEPGIRLRNPRLVADLAADHPRVAFAAIGAARLGEAEWLDLIPALPLAARGFLAQRRDLGPVVDARLTQLGVHERALPSAQEQAVEVAPPVVAAEPEPAPAPPPAPAEPLIAPPAEGIGAIVRRIEAFRRSREAVQDLRAANDAPRLPLGEGDECQPDPHAIRAFSFATDTAGRIGWADSGVAPMVAGLLLPTATLRSQDSLQVSVAETIRRRQPLRGCRVVFEGAPAIAGEWQVDATPEFDSTGHFTGYAGRMRRPAPPVVAVVPSEADRIRQILHELRILVNAIQGYAEMIHQQLAGPAPHEYRALAAGIAADAARMLAGFEELERLARLDSGVLKPESGLAELAMVVAGVVHQLEPHTASRSAGFALAAETGALEVPLDPAETERLVWRLLATMAAAARPGETVDLAVGRDNGPVVLEIRLPEALAGSDDLFAAAPPQAGQALSAGVFGTGFALRLAAAEARASGGGLVREGAVLRLVLPPADLTDSTELHTKSGGTARSA